MTESSYARRTSVPTPPGGLGEPQDQAALLRTILARERMLQMRVDELGSALRLQFEESLDMLNRLQEREEQAVRRSEERFRLLVESVSDYAIYMLDPAGRVVSWNAGAARITGYADAEVMGRDTKVFYMADQVAAGVPAAELTTAREQGRFETEGWRVRNGGEPYWASVAITVLLDEERRLLGFATIVRDLTERRRAELALQQTAAELRRSNDELEQFAYVASHDLQEPLRKIQAFGERLVRRSATLDAQGSDYVTRMQNAAHRMQTLIDDLLTFSRVTSQARPFALVDLGVLTREVLGDLEARIERSGGQVEVEPLPTIEADGAQMRRLMQNLIGNALKFRRDDAAPRVRVYATPPAQPSAPDAAYQIHVEDNGIGFDQKYAERIFEVFQRLHGRGVYEGTGIGLAICRKIVQRHGGAIAARGEPGRGATFTITLPARQVGGQAV